MVWGFFRAVLNGPSMLYQMYSQLYPPKPEWSTNDIPGLSGQVILITGANTGLGFECAYELAAHGARVYATARSAEKGTPAVNDLNARVAALNDKKSGEVVFLRLDLDDLKSVKAAVEEFKSREKRLDVLINNAGVMMPPVGAANAAGMELQFSTNVLGPFVLTKLLLPVLQQTARQREDGMVRIINISSFAHVAAPLSGIYFDDLFAGSKLARYGQSKLAALLFTNELARRYTDEGIVSISVNPGNIGTPLWRYQSSFFSASTISPLHPVSLGILTHLYASTSLDVTKADSGGYFMPWARKGQPLRQIANDAALASKLWDWCEAETKRADINA
ncbi:NAD(P)-binding protein [Wolfiporia cocos MD-104 SS10]|uniref:NAD(P)-binding protein n=1 Tax=Wolfiporia cocos (strain MD-104) TaxID=742152 RepID=A0A2H3JSS5_WOLCO|nr:NAD(P)-binding protein [Wolfiporia cocos MD-104 SS10]